MINSLFEQNEDTIRQQRATDVMWAMLRNSPQGEVIRNLLAKTLGGRNFEEVKGMLGDEGTIVAATLMGKLSGSGSVLDLTRGLLTGMNTAGMIGMSDGRSAGYISGSGISPVAMAGQLAASLSEHFSNNKGGMNMGTTNGATFGDLGELSAMWLQENKLTAQRYRMKPVAKIGAGGFESFIEDYKEKTGSSEADYSVRQLRKSQKLLRLDRDSKEWLDASDEDRKDALQIEESGIEIDAIDNTTKKRIKEGVERGTQAIAALRDAFGKDLSVDQLAKIAKELEENTISTAAGVRSVEARMRQISVESDVSGKSQSQVAAEQVSTIEVLKSIGIEGAAASAVAQVVSRNSAARSAMAKQATGDANAMLPDLGKVRTRETVNIQREFAATTESNADAYVLLKSRDKNVRERVKTLLEKRNSATTTQEALEANQDIINLAVETGAHVVSKEAQTTLSGRFLQTREGRQQANALSVQHRRRFIATNLSEQGRKEFTDALTMMSDQASSYTLSPLIEAMATQSQEKVMQVADKLSAEKGINIDTGKLAELYDRVGVGEVQKYMATGGNTLLSMEGASQGTNVESEWIMRRQEMANRIKTAKQLIRPLQTKGTIGDVLSGLLGETGGLSESGAVAIGKATGKLDVKQVVSIDDDGHASMYKNERIISDKIGLKGEEGLREFRKIAETEKGRKSIEERAVIEGMKVEDIYTQGKEIAEKIGFKGEEGYERFIRMTETIEGLEQLKSIASSSGIRLVENKNEDGALIVSAVDDKKLAEYQRVMGRVGSNKKYIDALGADYDIEASEDGSEWRARKKKGKDGVEHKWESAQKVTDDYLQSLVDDETNTINAAKLAAVKDPENLQKIKAMEADKLTRVINNVEGIKKGEENNYKTEANQLAIKRISAATAIPVAELTKEASAKGMASVIKLSAQQFDSVEGVAEAGHKMFGVQSVLGLTTESSQVKKAQNALGINDTDMQSMLYQYQKAEKETNKEVDVLKHIDQKIGNIATSVTRFVDSKVHP